MENKIGLRIRRFRSRFNRSQFDLENDISASPGSISRIENGLTNPTKETLISIKNSLGLNQKEFNYLLGVYDTAPSEAEEGKIISSIQPLFKKNCKLAYLTDETYRLVYVSKDLLKIFGLTAEEFKKIKGNSSIQFALDPRFGVSKIFAPNFWDEILYNLLERYYNEVAFMEDLPRVRDTLNLIESSEISSVIWNKIKDSKLEFSSQEKRYIYFLDENLKPVKMLYTTENLTQNERFEVIEYIPYE